MLHGVPKEILQQLLQSPLVGPNGNIILDPEQPFWERFYMVSPLAVIGTRNEDETPTPPRHPAVQMPRARRLIE